MPTNKEEIKETQKQTPKTVSAKKTTSTKKTATAPKKETQKQTSKTSSAKKTTSTKKATTVPKTEEQKQTPKTVSTKKTTSTKKATTTPKKEAQKQEVKKDFVEEAMDVVENIMDTKDTTNKYKEDDISKNTAVSIIAYFGILSLIPYFLCKDSKFAMFNAKQGVNLFILEVICSLLANIINLFTPWFIARAIIYVVYLIFILLSLIGIINVLNGKAKELPYVSAFKFIK